VSKRCTGMSSAAARKQTAKRTVIDINGFSHEIVGDWRAHTHLSPDACLEEKAKLEARRSAESR